METYIRYDKATGIVTFIHHKPFDPVHGLGETRDELLKTGVQAGAGAAVSDAVSKAKFEELQKKLKEAERKNWIYEYMRTRMRHRVKQTPVGLENMRNRLLSAMLAAVLVLLALPVIGFSAVAEE